MKAVKAGYPAAEAGLKADDHIIAINGKEAVMNDKDRRFEQLKKAHQHQRKERPIHRPPGVEERGKAARGVAAAK